MYNQACPNYPKQVCISLQFLQKSMVYEIDFLPADKHRIFLQIDSITLSVHGQACPKYSKQQLYNIFRIFPKFRKKQVYNVCIISIKKIEMKLVFYMQIIIEVANKLITTL